MDCPRCHTANPEVGRFCYRCGQNLRTADTSRRDAYAVNPNEPVASFSLVSTIRWLILETDLFREKLGIRRGQFGKWDAIWLWDARWTEIVLDGWPVSHGSGRAPRASNATKGLHPTVHA